MTQPQQLELSERESSVLGPLAEHRFLIVPQVAILLGVSDRTALNRLRALERERMSRVQTVFSGLPAAASITRRGLRSLESPLKAPPKLNYNEYRHDVGVGWMWLAARAGSFGELRALTTDRRMQAEDHGAQAAGEDPRWGVGVGMLGSHGRPQRHYPDLMLDTASGHRVAVELELTLKSSGRIGRIMAGYASDSSVDHVLYLAGNQAIAARVNEAARRAGIADRVHLQLLQRDGIAGAEIGRARGLAHTRAATRQRTGAQR